jgi:hypothetical protein
MHLHYEYGMQGKKCLYSVYWKNGRVPSFVTTVILCMQFSSTLFFVRHGTYWVRGQAERWHRGSEGITLNVQWTPGLMGGIVMEFFLSNTDWPYVGIMPLQWTANALCDHLTIITCCWLWWNAYISVVVDPHDKWNRVTILLAKYALTQYGTSIVIRVQGWQNRNVHNIPKYRWIKHSVVGLLPAQKRQVCPQWTKEQ